MRDIITSDATEYDRVQQTHDVIGLLKLIRQAVVSRRTTQHPVHAIQDTTAMFWRFKQGKLEVSEYLDQFKSLYENVQQKGGDIGISLPAIDQALRDSGIQHGISGATRLQIDRATETVREAFLAITFLSKANPKRYADLLVDIENEYTRNPSQSSYPKTLNEAYNYLVNYREKKRHSDTNIDGTDGMAFGQ